MPQQTGSHRASLVYGWRGELGKLSQTSLLNPNSGTDAVTLKKGLQLLVYNPALPGKNWYNGRGKLRVAESAAGKAWHDVATLADGKTEEYRYPAIIEGQNGQAHITHTYNHQKIKHLELQAK